MPKTREEIIELGRWCQLERKKLRITQEQLAERIGVSKSAIRNLEAGQALAVGKGLETALHSYFNAPEVALETLKATNSSGIEHLRPALKKIVAVTLQEDYKDRVKTIALAINISIEDAAIILLENILKK